MNLIEQLGGYEKAKIRLGSCDITLAYYQELDRQLLEYRRQHSIFEVGDLIVLCYTNYRDDVFELTAMLQETYDEKGIAYRHATPKEIHAGRRL